MKKVLLINYYWPPCGGSAVQRWLDLTANFEKLNIQTYVVTIDEKVATFPFKDYQLNERIAASTKVYKTGSSELFHLYDKFIAKKQKEPKSQSSPVQPRKGILNKIARFVRGNFLLPDPRKGWNKHAYAQAKKLIEQNRFDAVFTAGPPQSSHLIGLKLKQNFPNLKWVADLHDYWTDIFILKDFYRTSIAHFFDQKTERKILQKADHLMVHCQSARKLYVKKEPGIEHKIIVFTMGYNGILFGDNSTKGQPQDQFLITYAGILGEQYAPLVFLTALKQLVTEFPGAPVKFRLVGSAYPDFFKEINLLGMDEQFEYTGYVSQYQSIELIKKSTILLLLNPKVEKNEMIVPGKIYEYLAVRKPIISISHRNSENEQIILTTHSGGNFDWSEATELYRYLKRLFIQWQKDKHLDLPADPQVAKYERSAEATLLAKKLDI